MRSRDKNPVYCEIDFLLSFLDLEYEGSRKQKKSWREAWEFMCNSHIVLNISKIHFFKLAQDITSLNEILEAREEGECYIDFLDNFRDIHSITATIATNSDLVAIYLTSGDLDFCKKKQKELGVLVLNPECIVGNSQIFIDSGRTIVRKEKSAWTFLEGLLGEIPAINVSNTMIIVDNYFLNDSKLLKNNILPILELLLPSELSEGLTYEISIFAADTNKSLSTRYSLLKQELSRMKPKLPIKLGIKKCDTNMFHDRVIATNSLWMDCGHGFNTQNKDDVNNNASAKVSLYYQHFFVCSRKESVYDWINLLADAERANRIMPSKLNTNYWGDEDTTNRQIEWYIGNNIAK